MGGKCGSDMESSIRERSKSPFHLIESEVVPNLVASDALRSLWADASKSARLPAMVSSAVTTGLYAPPGVSGGGEGGRGGDGGNGGGRDGGGDGDGSWAGGGTGGGEGGEGKAGGEAGGALQPLRSLPPPLSTSPSEGRRCNFGARAPIRLLAVRLIFTTTQTA